MGLVIGAPIYILFHFGLLDLAWVSPNDGDFLTMAYVVMGTDDPSRFSNSSDGTVDQIRDGVVRFRTTGPGNIDWACMVKLRFNHPHQDDKSYRRIWLRTHSDREVWTRCIDYWTVVKKVKIDLNQLKDKHGRLKGDWRDIIQEEFDRTPESA